ncbi:GspH/FimT family pseudopilin [uncultured Thiodictyon sp.]|uniref:GspH/FimT family pseudopilin n=1 Tax=uncultured Thiodictyon sp. TaxID=1846217 RepID=UPI0025EB312C|nr:GspH/FimT family pseudopilin [uncultured Thiodictyon sp.]
MSGVTLVELLITLSIAVILLAVAGPSYQALLLNGRRGAVANAFVLALTYARSEAVKRAVPITLCSRATNATCADSTAWDGGWLVFVDNLTGRAGSVGTLDLAEQILLVYPALPTGTTLRSSARKRVTFQGTGFSAGFNDTFRLCDRRGPVVARSIILSNQGRVRTAFGTNSCP